MSKKKKESPPKILTPEEFVKKFTGYPWDMDELARTAVSDSAGPLADVCKTYLKALKAVEAELEKLDYEWG